MSSRPNPESVGELVTLAKAYRLNCEKVVELNAQIQHLVKVRDIALEASRQYQGQVLEALKNMDCLSSGNTGWQERLTYMLGQMTASI